MYSLRIFTEFQLPNGQIDNVEVFFDTYEETSKIAKIFVEQDYRIDIELVESVGE